MTREEAVEILKQICDDWQTDEEWEAMEMAIKALEQEPCDVPDTNVGDLISRQAVLDALHARFGVDFDYGKWWNSTHVLAAIESVPSVKSQEPKTAYWIWDGKSNVYRCSYCNHFPWRISTEENDEIFIDMERSNAYKFCSNCGARMEKPQESEVSE